MHEMLIPVTQVFLHVFNSYFTLCLMTLLRDKLYWLGAKQRITLKLCLLVYNVINGLAPSYLQDLCVPVTTVYTHSALCSAAQGDLVVPRTRRRLCNRAFCVTGPTAWNSLPPDIRTASSLITFKNLLKTHLFILSYYATQFEHRMLYGALVVTLRTCYGTLQQQIVV